MAARPCEDTRDRAVGNGADTLVAIHGGPGVNLESIADDFAALAQRHTVIFYDQRGAGRSTLPTDTTTLNATQQVSDLDAVRRHFSLAHMTLIAHSYGPLLAATYAIAHPANVARMIFIGPAPLGDGVVRRLGHPRGVAHARHPDARPSWGAGGDPHGPGGGVDCGLAPRDPGQGASRGTLPVRRAPRCGMAGGGEVPGTLSNDG